MAIADLIARFFSWERKCKRALPITAMAPLEAISTGRGTVIRDMRVGAYSDQFDGWITTTGPLGKEKDWADARYWVRIAIPADALAENANFTFNGYTPPPDLDAKGTETQVHIVTVTNEPEMPYNAAENVSSPTQTHYLPVGRQVRVRAVYASDGTRHYVMSETLAGGTKLCSVVTNSATVAGDYGSAVTSNRATLKYDVSPFGGGGTIGANIAPLSSPGRAFKQKVLPATAGIYALNGTNVVLYDVNEFADDQTICT